ncbi:unnamed protein product [Polarella glacialis]|uniref:Uncharacterized protein n=1 Tax=Polarella glacialis TaxID=89957 RepID=A0A813HZQ1_POLGL|nr:unnamed protein product [Polarella glacialis]
MFDLRRRLWLHVRLTPVRADISLFVGATASSASSAQHVQVQVPESCDSGPPSFAGAGVRISVNKRSTTSRWLAEIRSRSQSNERAARGQLSNTWEPMRPAEFSVAYQRLLSSCPGSYQTQMVDMFALRGSSCGKNALPPRLHHVAGTNIPPVPGRLQGAGCLEFCKFKDSVAMPRVWCNLSVVRPRVQMKVQRHMCLQGSTAAVLGAKEEAATSVSDSLVLWPSWRSKMKFRHFRKHGGAMMAHELRQSPTPKASRHFNTHALCEVPPGCNSMLVDAGTTRRRSQLVGFDMHRATKGLKGSGVPDLFVRFLGARQMHCQQQQAASLQPVVSKSSVYLFRPWLQLGSTELALNSEHPAAVPILSLQVRNIVIPIGLGLQRRSSRLQGSSSGGLPEKLQPELCLDSDSRCHLQMRTSWLTGRS